ncbi:MAG: purine permease [Prevotellaceae bacterium]|nr:purine permease [Prevotellaceae bacterium]
MSIYDLNGRPPLLQAIPVGLQHALALLIGNVAPIMLVSAAVGINASQVGMLVQCALLVAGVVTLIQLNVVGAVGAKLPVMMGTSFTYLAVAISVGHQYGMDALIGAIVVGALFQILLALWVRRIKRFFPPLVTGCIVLCLGITLIPTGMDYLAGGVGSAGYGSSINLITGCFTLLTVVVLQVFGRGFFPIVAILIGIVAGYLLAIPMGLINFTAVQEAAWVSLPRPALFGLSFQIEAIIPVVIICLITSLQSIGNIAATAMAGLNRTESPRELRGGLLAEGIGSLIAALLNALPTTTYAQNVGIIAMNKAINRFSLMTGAALLIVCGFIPKLAALVVAMPACVLGGVAILIFAMVATTGIQMVSHERDDGRATIITALSVGLGAGLYFRPEALTAFPEWVSIIFSSGLPVTAAISVLMNILYVKRKE